MAFTVVELEYINPPGYGPIFGVPIGTAEQAFELWKWASENAGWTCTMVTKLDNTQMIQIEGDTSATVASPIGGDRWIVYDSGKLIVFETAAEALTIYEVKS